MTPIQSANSIFELFENTEFEKLVIGYSGGKDSICCMDLAVKRYGKENVSAFYLYFLPDMDSDKHFVRMAETRWGIETIKLPHPEVVNYISNGILRPQSIELNSLHSRRVKWDDVENATRSKYGESFIAYGHRMSDSLQRRGMLNRCQGFWESRQRMYPLWQWKPADVLTYLRINNIPVPSMFGSSIIQTSGISLTTDCLLYLKENWKADYNRICKVFPFAPAMIYRDEMRAKYSIIG